MDYGITPHEVARRPEMHSLAARMSTFDDWSHPVSKNSLAVAGFYSLKQNHFVSCFHCGVILESWEEDDDPFFEHARWAPKCQYVILTRGQVFVDMCQKKQNEILNHFAMENGVVNPSVKAVEIMQHDFMKYYTEEIGIDANGLLCVVSQWLEDDQGVDLFTAISKKVSSKGIKGSSYNDEEHSPQPCVICLEDHGSIVLLPCGHNNCCASCACAVSTCPICRSIIKGVKKIYSYIFV